MITRDLIRMSEHLGDTDPSCGAVVSFAGVVRSHNDGRRVVGMTYDCYNEMAEREISRIVDEAKVSHEVESAHVVHRVGDVAVGEVSLWVVVRAAHRAAAFEASRWIVDEIKQRAPIWKKEHYADAASEWL